MPLQFRAVFAFALEAVLTALPIAAQPGTVYTATVIPTVAQSGGSTNVRIQIVSYTTDAEKAALKECFSKEGPDHGLALLRTMAKGYINVAGQSGRKIFAAFSVENRSGGRRLTLVTEHILSEYEKLRNVRAEDYPLTIVHIQFDTMGQPQSGEVIPAAKVSVTSDGFVDVATQTPNTAMLIDIARGS